MVRVWASLVAPEVMPERLTVWRPAFSLIVALASVLSVGGWLTGLTGTGTRGGGALVARCEGNRKGGGGDIVAGAAIVDGDRDGSGTEGVGHRRVADRAGRV